MLNRQSNDETIHINNSFTELFHLVKQTNLLELNTSLVDISQEANLILIHAENAMTGMLHGLQAIGNLVATSSQIVKDCHIHIGHFLTLIANLMEALNILRTDCEFQLSEKGQNVANSE